VQTTNESFSLIFRLVLAVLVGGIVGWNRQLNGKPAGLRTHMLVSLGAALFVLIPWQISSSHSPDALSRAIQGVATGVGFLGAGEIITQTQQDAAKTQVLGLTSAAAIWTTAALGMAAGCGLWKISLTGTLLVLLILTVAKRLERLALPHHKDDT
jgi:putative Mg2+ transporter-C (MgtC) family protein